jgi:hypothetical protein
VVCSACWRARLRQTSASVRALPCLGWGWTWALRDLQTPVRGIVSGRDWARPLPVLCCCIWHGPISRSALRRWPARCAGCAALLLI